MEDPANLKDNPLWDDVFDDDDIYKDEEFSEFLSKTMENLERLSFNGNALAANSEEDNADIEFMKFLGGLKNHLSKQPGESKSVSHLTLKSASSSKTARPQSASCTISHDTSDNHNIDEKRTSSYILRKIENKLKVDFIGNRDIGARKLYKVFNEKIFEKKLPEDMELEWSVDLKTTAGKTCALKKGNIYLSCKIILSTKVLITFERLRDTLLHEMCHAAVFLISQVPGENHGPLWKAWAVRCNLVLPDVKIPQRCHSYDLSYPFYYRCKNCEWNCGRYQRSKKLSESCCPKCRSSLCLVKS